MRCTRSSIPRIRRRRSPRSASRRWRSPPPRRRAPRLSAPALDLGAATCRTRAARCCARRRADPFDLAIVVADGLSSTAIHAQAVPFLAEFKARIAAAGWRVGPVAVASQARVALGDEVGELMQASAVVVLDRRAAGPVLAGQPGLYLTFAPRAGRSDAERIPLPANSVHRPRAAVPDHPRGLLRGGRTPLSPSGQRRVGVVQGGGRPTRCRRCRCIPPGSRGPGPHGVGPGMGTEIGTGYRTAGFMPRYQGVMYLPVPPRSSWGGGCDGVMRGGRGGGCIIFRHGSTASRLK